MSQSIDKSKTVKTLNSKNSKKNYIMERFLKY